ncbi:MAG: SpoIID/LytB domain-containing protein [Candidatus Krumholzibacteriota bacterium]|nr:SpoIID/LytB domain-containing protein [Candidatus Krumholzibacteriota bacterium]
MRLRIVAMVLAVLPGCTSTSPRYASTTSAKGPTIRALLVQTESVAVVRSTGPCEVRTRGGATVASVDQAATIRIERDESRLVIRIEPGGETTVVESALVLAPSPATLFRFDGTTYPGNIMARTYGHSSVLVVNVLDLETYLEGVVPHEIGDPGPEAYAAVRAQAIAARTYALARIEERGAEPFDVFAGVRDQVYQGDTGKNRLASSAVRDTRGLVLLGGGALVRAYYCATCGGHTSDIRRVWPQRESAPYLHGVFDRGTGASSYCDWVHNFRWRVSYSGRDLGEMLRKTLPRELGVPVARVGFITDLSVVERSPSGRVRVLKIETTSGSFRAQGDRIRWVLMADVDNDRILPSTMFDIEKVTRGGRVTSVSVIGGGNGHGVGMCQNGAIGMARQGYSHNMILSHYYPGTSLDKRY